MDVWGWVEDQTVENGLRKILSPKLFTSFCMSPVRREFFEDNCLTIKHRVPFQNQSHDTQPQ
jgi:hypothetical protein